MVHDLQRSQHVTRWSHLAVCLQMAQGDLGLYGLRLGLRSPAYMRIKMAKHVGCFWLRDAILENTVLFPTCCGVCGCGKYHMVLVLKVMDITIGC